MMHGLLRQHRGRSSMVERQLPKLDTRVRFPSPAPLGHHRRYRFGVEHVDKLLAQPTSTGLDAIDTGSAGPTPYRNEEKLL